ncbi:hypothetical protein POSPLADRAFT_1064166 [Postia placenta MAD-698-R-SB12]|uniref:Transmembrane protein 135 N-terminal domain-containing protein n=1 Tax=Postia placenta MAD-698-R-SB12 TaxID=670580 RepID=A0A1X6NG22_9APHY|nr:hypothetical protein POSPLADRAFT_1064166 [Postia placenta MAD-698-R-SB12]OSX67574.1 hypothetical protein POSPLADRAFT_1064166 [Postia placenta MAD-698-R-SB12]
MSSSGDIRQRLSAIPHVLADFLHSLPNDHPVQIALRTYALSLSLALGPAFLPFAISAKARRNGLAGLKTILKRELGVSGFAFAMTAGVGGGTAIRMLWDMLATSAEPDVASENKDTNHTWTKLWHWLSSLKDSQKTFISNMLSASVAISLFHSRNGRSSSSASSTTILPSIPPIPADTAQRPRSGVKSSITLDLTLLLLVRAMDSLIERAEKRNSPSPTERDIERRKRRLRTRLDALVFWACSARIMWCFFYEPERLPRSYNKWIMTLANIDGRILTALRALRSGAWSYKRHHSTQPDLLSSHARDLGYPSMWGDVAQLPAYGGKEASAAWKRLGVSGRAGVGGIPCELVHGSVTGGSCTANTMIRGAEAFAEAFAIYLPVHFLPILLTRPRSLLHARSLLRTLLSVLRSASFLSTFVSSIWAAVCLTRTLLLARLFPGVSHDVWDGPFGCTFAGSLVCGGSIWIEHGQRRGEIALYVLPRAIRACLPERWIRSGSRSVKYLERLTFMLSLSTILTAAIHQSESLRGLSRWTVAFVMNGPNAGFWKRKREETSTPPTPAESTPPSDTALPES